MAPRRLSEHDEAEWARYVRTVAPLSGRSHPPVPEPAPPAPASLLPAQTRTTVASAPRPRPAAIIGTQPGGVDTATWQRFRSGKIPVVRTLDLHGRTVQRAFHALVHFLHTAHAEQVRCVEVITGRGSGEGSGVLRRELPFWLGAPELAPLILAAAHPHPANPGSVRILLRRSR